MLTINISLPSKLKTQAEELIRDGLYVSFSDLVRDSLRQVVAKSKYDLWTEEARADIKKGRAKILRTKGDIDRYLKKI